jgi:glycosyltransferase involved in cell wall biosynthesis
MSGEGGRGLRIVWICQALDRDDPVLATAVSWIEVLIGRDAVDHVTALGLRVGRHELPPGKVTVRRFGRDGGAATAASFVREVARATRPGADLFFIYQGGPYPPLLMPFKLLRGIPIVQWKAHPVIDRRMAFYARHCDDLIFTSTEAAFPMDLDKVRVVGNGVDTRAFAIEPGREAGGGRELEGDLIALGRVMPSKRIEQMIRAVAAANRRFGTDYRFDFYGPVLPGSESYAAELGALIESLGAGRWVRLPGAVGHDRLPQLLNRYRATLNFSDTALDRAVLEAMACGLPAISSNRVFREAIPADLRPLLTVDAEATDEQAERIHEILGRDERELAALGQRVREFVVAEHSVERLFDRILAEVGRL